MKDFVLSKKQCEEIQRLVTGRNIEIPLPHEFLDIRAEVLECEYDEVSPFPHMNRFEIAGRIIGGEKVFQWRGLRCGKKNWQPFDSWRGNDRICVLFTDPFMPLKKIPIPYCRRACGFSSKQGYQCSAFGSYSQIELSPFLSIWNDMCSAESAQTCPMRIAQTWPKADIQDPIIKKFNKWLKTRKGYKETS